MPDIDIRTELASIKENIVALKQDTLRSVATRSANPAQYRATYLMIESRLGNLRTAHVAVENPNGSKTVEEFIEALATEAGCSPIRVLLSGADSFGKKIIGDQIGKQFDKRYEALLYGVEASLSHCEVTGCNNDDLLVHLRRQFQPKGPVIEQAQLAGLHPKIANKSEHHFGTAHYDDAIFNAFKTVEEEIRAKSKLPAELTGTTLVSRAMSGNPAILQFSTIAAEQDGAHALFRGGVGWFRNQHGHRFVGVKDRAATLETLGFASVLMRMLDEATINIPV